MTAVSQLTLKRRAPFPRITSLKLRPAVDRTGLNTQIPLPAIFWLKVTHTLDLVLPAIPHSDVGQCISRDHEARLLALADRDLAVFGVRGIDAVGLAVANQVVGGFGEGVCAADLVDIVGTGEAGDCGLGYVL